MTKEEIRYVKDGLNRQKLFNALDCIEFLETENEELKNRVFYLEDNLRVARKDREELKDAVANGLEKIIKDKPFTSLKLIGSKEVKENIKNICDKLFNILSEYEIGNYDSNMHQFYKDVYNIHNELMELAE